MPTAPLIDRRVGQYAERLVLKAEDLRRLEEAARAMRAREFGRLASAAATWFKTFIIEPIAGAIRAERAYRDLMALDDRTLADIGLRRDEIPAFVARTIASGPVAEAGAEPKAAPVQPKFERKLAA